MDEIEKIDNEMDELDQHCHFTGCKYKIKARGLCTSHYMQLITNRVLKPLRDKAEEHEHDTCMVVDCMRPFYAKKMCHAHYKKLLRHLHKEKKQLKGAEWESIE